LPTADTVKKLLVNTGWHQLRWFAPLLEFPAPGLELDLGGVVKEYAADRAATLCEQLGIKHGLINLGGDIRVIGPHPDGKPWYVGISNPQQPDSALQTIELQRGALASSGDYERCITIEGVRYGHVLNPFTGWPVSHLAAVSVLADFCVVAGSAATIGMLMEKRGGAWLHNLGLPHLWVDVNGNCGGSLN
jgi:thiamine biosynthesis lipoprotein